MVGTSQDGRSVRRLEDARFLLGLGRYVEDIASGDALQGYVLRSPHAHALIRRIDTALATALPGVHLIATAADLAADGLGPLPCMAAVKPLIVPPRALAAARRASKPPVSACATSAIRWPSSWPTVSGLHARRPN